MTSAVASVPVASLGAVLLGAALIMPYIETVLRRPGVTIAAELAVSPNTVKSQTASVYRKLMANSRRQAVTRSRELALLDG